MRRFSFAYDSNAFTPFNQWGPWVILAQAIGAIGVTFIIAKLGPEARRHGVPEVMD